jgi:hypothetical protein
MSTLYTAEFVAAIPVTLTLVRALRAHFTIATIARPVVHSVDVSDPLCLCVCAGGLSGGDMVLSVELEGQRARFRV